jgi:hypothetical protein
VWGYLDQDNWDAPFCHEATFNYDTVNRLATAQATTCGGAFSEPRQGRKIVAQGVSPGLDGPYPVRRLTDTPLPHGRERGRGVREGSLTPTGRGYMLAPVG